MFHTFAFCCLCCCCVFGVFVGTDALKSVTVMEGQSVILEINAMQGNDVIKWMFGTNWHLIAKTDEVTSEVFDGPDERFRDRLKLDKKTGSLTIMNIRTDHAGVYEVKISSSPSSTYRFNVTVYASPVPVTSRDTSSSSSPSSSPPSPSSGLPKCEHVNITELCQTCAEGHAPCCDSVEAVLRLVVTALMGVASAAAAVLMVNDVRASRAKTKKAEEIS